MKMKNIPYSLVELPLSIDLELEAAIRVKKVKGGAGSGYHDPHYGLPGHHGGSSPREGGGLEIGAIAGLTGNVPPVAGKVSTYQGTPDEVWKQFTDKYEAGCLRDIDDPDKIAEKLRLALKPIEDYAASNTDEDELDRLRKLNRSIGQSSPDYLDNLDKIKALSDRMYEHNALIPKAVAHLLKDKNAPTISYTLSDPLHTFTSDDKGTISEAVKMASDVFGNLLSTCNLRFFCENRAGESSSYDNVVEQIKIAPYDRRESTKYFTLMATLHELGHVVDMQGGYQEGLVDYHLYRAGPNAIKRGPGQYVMNRDDFFTEYMGKFYFRKRATEIFSCGIEYLFNDPTAFITNDRQSANLIIGLITSKISKFDLWNHKWTTKGGKGSGYKKPHIGRPGEIGGSYPRKERLREIKPGVYEVFDASLLPGFYISAVSLYSKRIFATKRTDLIHAMMLDSINSSDNVDDYVRFWNSQGYLSTSTDEAGIVLDKHYPEDDEQRALKNIYMALDWLVAKGLPQNTRIRIHKYFYGVASSVIDTTAKEREKGGVGSGYGDPHFGRPGQIGGSTERPGFGANPKIVDRVRKSVSPGGKWHGLEDDFRRQVGSILVLETPEEIEKNLIPGMRPSYAVSPHGHIYCYDEDESYDPATGAWYSKGLETTLHTQLYAKIALSDRAPSDINENEIDMALSVLGNAESENMIMEGMFLKRGWTSIGAFKQENKKFLYAKVYGKLTEGNPVKRILRMIDRGLIDTKGAETIQIIGYFPYQHEGNTVFLDDYGIILNINELDMVRRIIEVDGQYIAQMKERRKGGAGSGYDRPHFGRPGKIGGSLPRSDFVGNANMADMLELPPATRGTKKQITDGIKEATALIDQVHRTDNSITKVPVKIINSQGNKNSAEIFRNKRTDIFTRIQINQARTSMAKDDAYGDLWHEYGHLFNITSDGKPLENNTPEAQKAYNELIDAIRNSEGVKKLQDMLDNPRHYYEHVINGKNRHVRDYRSYLRYYNEESELFARAYSQYVATKLNHASSLADHYANSVGNRHTGFDTRIVEYKGVKLVKIFFPTQWKAEDYKPIEVAMDNYFRSVKWID